jgi:beta-phosphoglucomutase family hydrolase
VGGRLGLTPDVRACLFDLDGVLTRTAVVHNAAWTETFDAFLRARAEQTGEPFRAFDPGADYNTYVDGKPREDGVRDFLASRGIRLDEGARDDPPGALTVFGLGNHKNEILLRTMRDEGVQVYEGSVRYVHAVRQAGMATAVVSASANTADVLRMTGIADLFDTVVDAKTADVRGLRGKPAPDTFVEAARELGVDPVAAAVFEDALSGVAAGRAGGFATVVGVDRVGHGQALQEHGADRVVTDLEELLR